MNDKVTGLIISAGLSSRLKGFKPLLKLPGGKSFICLIADKLSTVCDEIIIVSGHKHELLSQHLESNMHQTNYRIIHNPGYREGMFSSLQAAAKEINSGWILYHFVDQPGLPLVFYSEFIKQIDDIHNWIQPVNIGRKGHPVLFNNPVSELIRSAGSSLSLRDIGHSDKVVKKFWEYNSKYIFQDIDTDKDYAEMSS